MKKIMNRRAETGNPISLFHFSQIMRPAEMQPLRIRQIIRQSRQGARDHSVHTSCALTASGDKNQWLGGVKSQPTTALIPILIAKFRANWSPAFGYFILPEPLTSCLKADEYFINTTR